MIQAFLFDLDGTLYTHLGSIPGAVSALTELRRRGFPFRYVTNTTRTPRASIVDRLRSYGFAAEPDDVQTPLAAASVLLAERDVEIAAPFLSRSVFDDLDGLTLEGGTTDRPVSRRPDAVIVGDLGDAWTPALVNEAFRFVMDGSYLVALHKGRYWLGPEGLEVDAGAWVAAVEYAANRAAVVCGKPEAAFFRTALTGLGATEATSVMVGDDLWNDVAGAQRVGMQGWLVRTGKFREDALAGGEIQPDRVVESVADLPGLV